MKNTTENMGHERNICILCLTLKIGLELEVCKSKCNFVINENNMLRCKGKSYELCSVKSFLHQDVTGTKIVEWRAMAARFGK
jgi:hypothetical protein